MRQLRVRRGLSPVGYVALSWGSHALFVALFGNKAEDSRPPLKWRTRELQQQALVECRRREVESLVMVGLMLKSKQGDAGADWSGVGQVPLLPAAACICLRAAITYSSCLLSATHLVVR